MDTPEKYFRKLLRGFRTAMLTTRTPEGTLHARPLQVARLEDDGTMWFALHASSRGVMEMDLDPHVNVCLQGRRRFLSISGDAHVLRDASLVQSLWHESWRPWFPPGPGDPDLALVRVEPVTAEYWDDRGMQRLKLLARSMRAQMKGIPASPTSEAHESLELQ